jgi:hypothetical protein
MDVLVALESMDEFTCYMPSWPVIKFLLVQLLPFRFSTGDMISGSSNSSLKDKATTKKEIEEHYNRGNDFFNAFLGPRMVYTSAVFESDTDTLETAQDNKMRKICEKLRLKPGDKVMDIGCGWGTLAGCVAYVESERACRASRSANGDLTRASAKDWLRRRPGASSRSVRKETWRARSA